VVGPLDADGRRFLAMPERGDDGILDLLSDGEPFGASVHVR
jgi:acetyl-CoA C-acetyltransferase